MSELVREAIDHYHQLLADRHLASTRDVMAAGKSRILRPHFVERTAFDEIMRATTLLNRALVTAADRLAADAALRRKLGIPDYIDRLVEVDRERGLPSMIGRFDALVDRAGVFKIIEYNASPGFNYYFPRAYASLPITAEFAQRFAFHAVNLPSRMLDLLQVRDESAGKLRPAVLGVAVSMLPPPRDKYAEPTWAESDDGRGCRVIEATVDEFRFDGGRLTVDRGERVPIDILLMQWDDLIEWAPKGNTVLDAVRAGAVRTLMGASRGVLCGYKHTFELLSNPEYGSMFDAEVTAALARHVPWTRAVRNAKTSYDGKVIDLLPFVAERRERFVLKPSGGSKGMGVVLGHQCTDAVWRQTLKRALNQKYVVQERVLASAETFPFAAEDGSLALESSTPTCEPFVWSGHTAADAVTRLSSTDNHTLGGGGSEAALWILESRR